MRPIECGKQRALATGKHGRPGRLLAGDVNPLAVTHGGAPSHVTVMGHSYGSTTVADAAPGSGMHANDIVLVRCPETDKAEAPGLTFPLKDYSSYFTPGNESLFGIADIASGHGDALAHDSMTAQHRGTYWLPDELDPESLRRPTRGHYH